MPEEKPPSGTAPERRGRGPIPEEMPEVATSTNTAADALDDPVPPAPHHPVAKALHFAYYVVLQKIETAVLLGLLGAVVLLPLIELINRNTRLNFWDGTLATRLAYICTFYVGLFGGVFATRYARHISVDLVAPYLSPYVRHKLAGILFLVSAVACVFLTKTAYRFVFWVVSPDDRFFPSVQAWWGLDRVWKTPFVVAFSLMTLHFAVEGVRRLLTAPANKDALAKPPAAEPSARGTA